MAQYEYETKQLRYRISKRTVNNRGEPMPLELEWYHVWYDGWINEFVEESLDELSKKEGLNLIAITPITDSDGSIYFGTFARKIEGEIS